LSKGSTRSITEGRTKFLGKLIESATKKAASKQMIAHLTDLLTCTSHPWRIQTMDLQKLYHFFIKISFCVDAGTISKLQSIATRFLKKWLKLPCSASRVILYYPGLCCRSVSHVSKLSLLSCISATSDLRIQELGLQLRLGFLYRLMTMNTLF